MKVDISGVTLSVVKRHLEMAMNPPAGGDISLMLLLFKLQLFSIFLIPVRVNSKADFFLVLHYRNVCDIKLLLANLYESCHTNEWHKLFLTVK